MEEFRVSRVHAVYGYEDGGIVYFRVNASADGEGTISFMLSDEAAKALVEKIEVARRNPDRGSPSRR
jgi:hypothetical protein